mmetsp:Transcript_6265/g.12358  ORF Transcript_6265/g.12358 Transcript_6265/m.12358 type:complete len:280 (-) Transcript_6265:254-1093(-)
MRLYLAVKVVRHELFDCGLCAPRKLLRCGALVLLHGPLLLRGLDEVEARDVLLRHAEVVQHVRRLRAHKHRHHLAVELLGLRLEGLLRLRRRLLLLVAEEQRLDFDGAAEDLAGGLLAELRNVRHLVDSDPLLDLLRLHRAAVHDLALVKRLVQDNILVLLGGVRVDGSVVRDGEANVIDGVSSSLERLRVLAVQSVIEPDHHNVAALLELVELIRSRNRLGSRPHLLLDPAHDGVVGTTTLVLRGLSINEPLEGGEPLHVILFANVLVGITVNLCQLG